MRIGFLDRIANCATINRWHREAPALVIVPGHEWEALFTAPDHWGMVIERGLVPVDEHED